VWLLPHEKDRAADFVVGTNPPQNGREK